jgi:hypothetical protein
MCEEEDAMKIDPRVLEEMAQQLYADSDRTGVAWVRRPESVKHAFREAAEKKLRILPEGHGGHGSDRNRQSHSAHRPHGSIHRGKPLMEPSTI